MTWKILLIDVEFDKSNDECGQLQTNWTHHPLGLMYLSAYAKEHLQDIEIKIFHTVTVTDSKEHVKNLIKDFAPNLVGLRALSLFQKQYQEIAEVVRKARPEAVVVGGGPYTSASYEDILNRQIVDIAVIEEGEVTFVELITRLREDAVIPTDVHGTAVLVEGAVRMNPKRMLVADIDSLPFPDYEQVDLDSYSGFSNHAFQSANECAFIYSSRGCPYRCYYCHEALVKTVRRRSPENVVLELEEHYHRRGIKNFVFADDIFNVPKKIGKEILHQVIDRLPGVSLNFPNGLRADQLDDEFLDLLEKAGTVHMALAVETASPRLQKVVGKNLKIEKTRGMIEHASKRFVLGVFYMIGFPTETRDEAIETIAFAESLKHVVQPVMSIVRVYPGLPLYTALNATEEQKRRIEQQTAEALQPKMDGDPSFYGDFFSDEEVPLKSSDIRELRWEWIRRVVQDPERIRNSFDVLRQHFDDSQVLEFYRNMYDKLEFSERDLNKMLKFAGKSDDTLAPERVFGLAS